MNSVIYGNRYSGSLFQSFSWVALLILAGSVLTAQNLISNPGFEKCDRCGMFGNSGVELSLGIGANDPVDWYGVTYGTSDFRPEQPNSGKYHGGFFSFGKFEYLGNVLSAPLVAGAEYELTCFMGTRFDSEFTLDEIGFCFQQGLNTYPVNGPLTRLTPQVTTPDGDFLPFRSYRKFAFRFIACGGEDHLILGRFKDLSMGDTVFVGTKRTGSAITYTIIDDLELKMVKQAPNLLPDHIEICKGISRKIGLNAGIAVERLIWSNGSSADSVTLDGSDSLIWVEVILAEGCAPIRDTARVVVLDIKSNLLQDTTFLCPEKSIFVNPDSTGFTNPVWSDGVKSFANTFLSPGLYTLSADSPCGALMDSIRVISPGSLPTEIFPFSSICLTDGLSLEAPFLKGVDYRWSDGTLGRFLSPKVAGIYVVEATGVCDQILDTVLVEGKLALDSIFLIPNVFTPNGDQNNDSFRPLVREGAEFKLVEYDMKVFNRWGEVVFETQDFTKSWNPDINAPVDSYIFQFKLRYWDCPEIRSAFRSGVISLIR